ncbi:hypothetical protein DPMN_128457 [Dreissena polymorpha]|uniref:Uncharacterized protein n=1 Tax=Dreissena polymorpha TaxID=45954 RepID=A0A9D4JWG1_DREPO|nr:hypothetical protein DPMN_128457 [Dreissena polymorpha]
MEKITESASVKLVKKMDFEEERHTEDDVKEAQDVRQEPENMIDALQKYFLKRFISSGACKFDFS